MADIGGAAPMVGVECDHDRVRPGHARGHILESGLLLSQPV